ncbi:MAG: hypothetical protein AAF327_15850 [Cyanobacteria bacterium P01_A01_bin.37]
MMVTTPAKITIADGATQSSDFNVAQQIFRIMVPASTNGTTFTIQVKVDDSNYATLRGVSIAGSANAEMLPASVMRDFINLRGATIRVVASAAPSGTSHEFLVWGG